jgi:hypothetical protein
VLRKQDVILEDAPERCSRCDVNWRLPRRARQGCPTATQALNSLLGFLFNTCSLFGKCPIGSQGNARQRGRGAVLCTSSSENSVRVQVGISINKEIILILVLQGLHQSFRKRSTCRRKCEAHATLAQDPVYGT